MSLNQHFSVVVYVVLTFQKYCWDSDMHSSINLKSSSNIGSESNYFSVLVYVVRIISKILRDSDMYVSIILRSSSNIGF